MTAQPVLCPCGGTAALRLHSRLLTSEEIRERIMLTGEAEADEEAHEVRYECPACGRVGRTMTTTEPEAAWEFATAKTA